MLLVDLRPDPFTPPPPGAWRSLAEMDAGNADQVGTCATRFGSLTSFGWTEEIGEPLRWWRHLVSDLRPLAKAWNPDGTVGDAEAVTNARTHGHRLAKWLTSGAGEDGRGDDYPEVEREPWELVADGVAIVMRCPDMSTFWRIQALSSIAELSPMTRCQHCGVWFSLGTRRSDAKYCSNSHRSLATQRRPPPARFWEI